MICDDDQGWAWHCDLAIIRCSITEVIDVPKRSQPSAATLLTALASASKPSGCRSSSSSIGKTFGVRASPIEELMHASDVATKLLQSASTELRLRAQQRSRGGAETPTILANSHAGILQALLGDGRLRHRVSELEGDVRVTVSPRTRSGLRLRDMRGRMREVSLTDARPDETHLARTVDFLRAQGMKILRVGRFGQQSPPVGRPAWFSNSWRCLSDWVRRGVRWSTGPCACSPS